MASKGRVALVTGATSGIGRATAIELAGRGDFVIVSGRDEQRGNETCAAIRKAGGECALVLADLTDAESTQELAKNALAAGEGRVDILVNNAGGGYFPDGSQFKPTESVTPADFERIFAVDARAAFLLTAALAPVMVENGGGAIVNVLAISSQRGWPGVAAFAGAKAAVASFTRTWAVEFAPTVRVNGVDLGSFDTPAHAGHRDELFPQLLPSIPVQRIGLPEEAASVISFLTSDAASYVSGAILPVDGGRVIAP
jgi:NAD(P)-dependent dehydrogenase (short-subunit alcohol dehydrogenase family)